MGGGTLIKLPRDQIEDVYNQIDKDKSGAISFEEFWAWFQFEAKKNPKKMKLELTQIMTIRERATRKLLLEFNRGEITEDDGAKVEKYRGGPNPRNHPANVTETAEKSPKNQTRPKSPA